MQFEKNKSQNDEYQKTYILDLPNEILLRIFSYLDAICLNSKIKLVCKSWNILASDSSLWKSITFEEKDDMSHVSEVIGKCSQLRKLSIRGGVVDSQIISTIALLPFLSSLSFKFCHILSEPNIFQNLMVNSQRLKSLDLEGCKVNPEILAQIFNGKKLEYLNLNHCVQLENQHLIKILENCTKLEHLDIDGINFLEENAISYIFKICSNSIISLMLDGESLSDDAFVHLEDCKKLTKLSISFCDSISDGTLHRIKQLENLKYLKLRKGASFSSFGLETMFKCGSLSHISHLNLSECSLLEDNSLIAMTNCCPELLSLSLSWCWELTDVSLFHVVRKCTKLIVLDLTGVVRLLGLFLINLQQGMLKDLRIIDLQQCGCIEDQQLTKLAQLRRSLTIFDFWGDKVTVES